MNPVSPRTLMLVRRASTALTVTWVLALLIVFALRLTFPLELEWMEGGVLHQALRLQRGDPIYPPPSVEFVPFLYTPLYTVVLAALGSVVPLDFVLGRIVSIAAVGAIAIAAWRAVERDGKPRAHRALAVGLMCSGYVFTFRWLDLVRPDAMYMALTLWALVLLRSAKGNPKKAALAGLLMALAFWTKQTAAVFVLASAVGCLIVAPRQFGVYAGVIAVVAGGGVLLGNALTDGWLWHYIYTLHQTHAFNHERLTTKTWAMFVHAAPFACLAVAVIAVEASRRRGTGVLYWGLMATTAGLVSAMGYATQWAEPNAFIPGVVVGAVFLAVALPTGGRAEVVGLGLACAQLVFALLVEPMYQPVQDRGWAGLGHSYAWQDPVRTVPSAHQRARAAGLREALRAESGPVLALGRPWWSVIAGGEGHVGSMGINDVDPQARREIQAALRRQLEAGHYRSVWFEGAPPSWLRGALRGYRVAQRHRGDARVRPMTGYMSEAGMVTPYSGEQILFVRSSR